MSVKSLFIKNKVKIREEEAITLDPQQEEAVTTNSRKVLVVAGAGSGKTRVLTERVKYLLQQGVEPSSIVAITFTNMASEEMRARLSSVPNIGDCFIGTIHSFANKVMKASSDKKYKILDTEVSNAFYKELIQKYCKFLTYDAFLHYQDIQEKYDLGLASEEERELSLAPSQRAELMLLQGLNAPNLDEINNDDYPETIKDLCKKHNVITFNELLEMATKYFESIESGISHLLIDEFQDIGKLEFDFFKSLKAENEFYVGDDWQCQPKGTKVTMEDGSIKNIEDLKIGDKVLSYNQKEGRYYKKSLRGSGKQITDISVHNADNLVTIITNTGKESSYTKNHRCFARIHYTGNEDKSVVYIMENNKGQFRVGSTKLFSDRGRNFGVRNRMNTEGAINAWILDVYNTPQEAWLAEQICSYKFGIPQVTWTYKNIRSTKEDIDALYRHLGNLRENVIECLKVYGRDINYPIFIKNTNTHFSKIHITEIRACNLIPLVMDVAVPYLDEYNIYKQGYEQITHKFVIDDPQTIVYGLKVEDTETYVADGILTHNSIYGFKGGQVNIMLTLAENPEYTVLPIATNYRNSKEVLQLSTKIINQVSNKIHKDIVISEDTMEGEVYISSKAYLKTVVEQVIKEEPENLKDWFILVRTNKDLLEVSDILDECKLRHTTFRREGLSVSDLNNLMNYNSVKVLTVHTAKGLEAKNVILYGSCFSINVPKYRNNQEERKVMYVGVTRAIENLVILN